MSICNQQIQRFTLSSILLFSVAAFASANAGHADKAAPQGMVLIPGGSFEMGGDPGLMDGGSQSHGTSYPIHEVSLDPYWIDTTEVTNAEFAAFVEDTGYLTLAERPLPQAFIEQMKAASNAQLSELRALLPQLSGHDKDGVLQRIERIKDAANFGETAGAIVFSPPQGELYGKSDITQWWRIVVDANWRMPEGPESTWVGRENHPVVNVSPEDAAAYANWAGKRLPTEAEWERAARGGLIRKQYTWGDDFSPNGNEVWMANIWQGVWPYENTAKDGFVASAPVKSFPPNAYGLYDMSGNVWEIVADRYHPYTYQMRSEKIVLNPTGPSAELFANSGQRLPIYVSRGGSFLCSDSWCSGYQPGSRQPSESDSPSNHTGFRCAMDVAPQLTEPHEAASEKN